MKFLNPWATIAELQQELKNLRQANERMKTERDMLRRDNLSMKVRLQSFNEWLQEVRDLVQIGIYATQSDEDLAA